MEDIKIEVINKDNKNIDEIINKILILQDKIMYNLSKNEGSKLFLLKKTKNDYINILKNNHIIVIAKDKSENIIASTITKNSNHNYKQNNNINKIECGNCMVDPQYQGNNILLKLLDKIKKYYENQNKLLTAEIVYNNFSSIKSFLKAGFIIANSEICKDDGAKLINLFYLQNLKFNKIENKKEIKIENTGFEEYQNLTKANKAICLLDKKCYEFNFID